MNAFNVAIVGAGIGREHLAAYLTLPDDFNVVMLCDKDEARAAQLTTNQHTIRVVSDLASVLQDPSIEVVDICLPPHLHKQAVIDALNADKHVVCEKPLVTSLSDADEIGRVMHGSTKTLTPVFQYRYGPALSQLRALMNQGYCGKPLVASIETHWHRDADYYNNPWRGTWQGEQGGAVLGHAIHNHDLLCSVFGPVARLSAFTTTRVNDIETEDCASVSLQMANGAVASSSITLGAADDTSRLRFCFEKLTATSGTNPYAPADAQWQFQARGSHSQAGIDDCLASVPNSPVGYLGLFTELAQKLRGLPNECVSFEDGRRSLELVTAIYHASRTQQSVVLPLDDTFEAYNSWQPQR
jgi:predicted dehydrogenase